MALYYDASSAYLGPLLKKHAAGQPLVWEDLVASHAASADVLRQNNNTFVSSRMDRLHQSQIKAYREAAIHSIKEWSASLPLQPMEEGDSKTAFVGRCIAAAGTSAAGMNGHALPNWELATAKATAINEIRKRANATYEKYHPVEEGVVVAEETKTEQAADKNEAGTADPTADETDGDGGADTEDGEMTGDDEISDEDGEVDTSTPGATTTTKVAKPTQAKYTHPNRKKQNVGGNIINNNKNGGTQVRKKGTNAKAGYRTNNNNNNNRGGPANRGGRRGGRGGGNRVQK